MPVFACMLSHDGMKHPKKIKGNCLIEYKYDGVRVIAITKKIIQLFIAEMEKYLAISLILKKH